MLNYWRTTAATGGGGGTASTCFTARNPLIPAATHDFSDYGFDGPFFDLEFTLSDHESSEASETATASGDLSESDDEMTEIELNFDVHDHNFNKIPDENSRSSVSFLKSTARFRVLLLKLKKLDSSNGEKVEKSEKIEDSRVRFEVDEVKGSLISLFASDYSTAYLGKEMMQKYLNILKPLYAGVEKLKSSGPVRFHGGGGGSKCGGAVSPPPEIGLRRNNLPAGLRVARKHFGKRRSAVSPPAKVGSNRHDESVQDGIQGAILHCKRSFNFHKH